MEKFANQSGEIRQVGNFLPVDERGYIRNELSEDNIQRKWQPVVEDTINSYKQHFGNKLLSVYLRGSVANGLAIDGISDVDNFAVVDLSKEDLALDWKKDFKQEMKEKYPYVDDVEVEVFTLEEFCNGRNPKMFAKTQSLLVYGENLIRDLPEYKIGKDMVAHGFGLQKSIEQNRNYIRANSDNADIVRSRCKVMMKRIVRVGMEIVMVRANKYTRDLYLCWQEFARYYPEKSEEMRRALELAVDPTDDVEEIEHVFDSLGAWLVRELEGTF